MKKVDQVLFDGNVVEDYDQPLSSKRISTMFYDLFGTNSKMDGNQHVLFEQFGLLVSNITYLGHPWPVYKKRIQLKSYYPDYYKENLKNHIKTFLVGIYHYNRDCLFALFDAGPYMQKKSHNSSAHVQTFDLQYAAKKGLYSKIDKNGNRVLVMDQDHFVNFFKNLAEDKTSDYSYETVKKEIIEYISSFASVLPKGTWKGIQCYKEMEKNGCRNYRQCEWAGFYFEYLFEKFSGGKPTSGVSYRSDKSKDGIDFDVVFSENKWVFGDLKADNEDEDILGNKFDSFEKVISQHGGKVLYVVLRYKPELDKNHNYQTTYYWNNLRDKKKKYTDLEELKSRYGSKMKYSVTPKSIRVISIDETVYGILKTNPFRQGRNSNGKARAPKLKINKDVIEALSVYGMDL